MRRGSRRVGIALVIVGVVVALSPLAVWAEGSSTADFSGFFSANSEASGLSMTFGDPKSAPYPVAAGTLPETQSSVSNGSTYALASAAWPGPLGANAGGLAGLVWPPCAPSTPAGQPCAPPLPSGVNPSVANYPLRAEASSSGGKDEHSLGPMNAKVDGATADSRADIGNFDGQAVGAGKSFSHSTTYVEGDHVVTLGESTVSGITAAGGQITIDAVETSAKVVTNGDHATIEKHTLVKGLSIGGHAATVDENGVHFEGSTNPSPFSPVLDPVNDQILKNLGITMYMTKPYEEKGGDGEARVSTGSLVIYWDFFGSGNIVIASIGGATAHGQAAPGFTLPKAEEPLPDLGVTGVGTPAAAGSSSAGSPIAAASGPVSSPTPARPAPRAAAGGQALRAVPAGHFATGIDPGMFVFSLIGALIAGVGLRQLRTAALGPAAGAAVCPNDERRGA